VNRLSKNPGIPGGGLAFSGGRRTDCLDADDNKQRGQQLPNKIIRSSCDPLGGGLSCGDQNGYVAYFPIDALGGVEDSEDGIVWVNHEYIKLMFWFDYTDPEGQTKKTKEQIAREKTGGWVG
jgi:secreted PhoX family phosphatase